MPSMPSISIPQFFSITIKTRDHRSLSETPENPHVNVDLDSATPVEAGSSDPVSPTDLQKRQILPSAVVSSELQAGQQPISEPGVIREKNDMQDELRRTVAEKQ
ncbi:hypothetical protein LTR62_001785 [Meristemomyces frigidus]|uniref:Uncharacterized protein n=1 Tax=Meristemomyces frigidus TaxID=1508187 RepID=A0AAN7TGE4_9PEZI|nr:hypothetical protein LTR62_001785 [Meristemomyces frigidus]